MTLISVHASAQLHGESSTVVTGFSPTDTSQKDTTTHSESQTFSNTTEYQTTEATTNVNTTVNETSPVPTSKSSSVDSTTEESTLVYAEPTTKQTAETTSDATSSANVETTTSKSNQFDSTKLSTESTIYHKSETSTMAPTEKQQDVTTISSKHETTTTVNDGTPTTVKAEQTSTTTADSKEHGNTTTQSAGHKSSTDLSPEEFFNWLDSIEPNNQTDRNVTEKEETKSNIDTNAKTTDWLDSLHEHDHHQHDHLEIDPNRMAPKEFFEWLDSIHPDSNTTKNIIDTSIISTEKLIIVISTICGTFVLFVAILIAISCCRRKRNLRNDSEKSDFSMNSVISHTEKRNSCNSDIFTPDKNGFNNVFMGIPANNEVWKKLDQLSPTASAVMPESTKM